jgi:hypothetical protein
MNAELFYEKYKQALLFLGTKWGYKEKVQVWCDGDQFHMSYDGKEVSIFVPKEPIRLTTSQDDEWESDPHNPANY